MKNKGKLICKVNNLAVLMEDLGQGPIFMAVIVNDKGDILASTQLDIALVAFLIKSLDVTISELFVHNVRENWYGEIGGENIPEQIQEEKLDSD